MSLIETRAMLEAAAQRGSAKRAISSMAQSLVASEILKIAQEVRMLMSEGAQLLDLTVGDFNPALFPIPAVLENATRTALSARETNYPPSSGMLQCRKAVQKLFRDRLGLDYPLESVLIAAGARPMIAGTYLALVNPGDEVVYSLPSWNNNHYCTLRGAKRVEVPTSAASRFFPRAQDIAQKIRGARLICLNTPQNPTGTVIAPEELEALCRLIVEENQRRDKKGEPSLYLMFDQVYWLLTFHGAVHKTPVELVPEMAPYTIFVDGISKGFAATGLRVGWAVGPTDVIERMAAILTHIGAWAPRAEQIATAELLGNAAEVDRYTKDLCAKVIERLDRLNAGIARLRSAGHAVEAIEPAGAIYSSLRINISGRTTPSGDRLKTDEEIRSYLLREAGMALVPFQAFGLAEDSGWFRASVGAVSVEDIDRGLLRLESALQKLR